MVCAYCGERDNSRLGLRSSFVNGKLETKEICTSCLYKKLVGGVPDDGKTILERKYITERKPVYN